MNDLIYSCLLITVVMFLIMTITALIKNRKENLKENIARIVMNLTVCFLGFLTSVGVLYILHII